jgi:hypothetical protein
MTEHREPLSEVEIKNRRRALNSALGSLRIEGMFPEPEVIELLEKCASGEITIEEAIKASQLQDQTNPKITLSRAVSLLHEKIGA